MQHPSPSFPRRGWHDRHGRQHFGANSEECARLCVWKPPRAPALACSWPPHACAESLICCRRRLTMPLLHPRTVRPRKLSLRGPGPSCSSSATIAEDASAVARRLCDSLHLTDCTFATDQSGTQVSGKIIGYQQALPSCPHTASGVEPLPLHVDIESPCKYTLTVRVAEGTEKVDYNVPIQNVTCEGAALAGAPAATRVSVCMVVIEAGWTGRRVFTFIARIISGIT